MKNLSEAITIAGIFVLIILFTGKPDLMDAIIQWLMAPRLEINTFR